MAADALHWSGDLGLGVERTQASAPGASARTWALPYAYGDLGRLFVREDTFGAKLVPVGWGALEVVGRVSTEGSDGDGPRLAHRRNPRPFGFGTFQETPWGGVFFDAFADTVSGGTLLEMSYAAELPLGACDAVPAGGRDTPQRALRCASVWGGSVFAGRLDNAGIANLRRTAVDRQLGTSCARPIRAV